MARSFGGTNSDHIDLGNVLDLSNQDYSVACWVKTTGTAQQLAVDKFNGYQLGLNAATAGALSLFNGTGGTPGQVLSTTVLTANVWHHAAGTYSFTNTRGRLYLDGALDTTNASMTVGPASTTNILEFGRASAFGGFGNWSGALAEVAIWTRELTAAEVAALAKGIPAPLAAPSGLVGYWPLHGVSTTESDLSGGRHSGTVTGTTVAAHAPVGALGRVPGAAWAVSTPAGTNFPQALTVTQATSATLSTIKGKGVILAVTQATTAAVGKGVGKLLARAQGAVPRAYRPSPIWPNRPAPSAANFFDDFPGSSLNARWTALTSGTGAVTVTDSYVQMDTVAANQAAAIYYGTKLDKTKSQRWRFTMSCENRTGTGESDFFRIVNKTTAPAVDTITNLQAITRLEVGVANQSGGLSLLAWYFDGSQTQQYWNATAGTWGAYNSGRFQPTQLSDYYQLGLDIDGPNARFRLAMWGQAFTTPGTYTNDQGWRLFGLTDWVSWSSLGTSTDLWLVLGHLDNNSFAQDTYRAELVEYSELGPAGVIDALVASKSALLNGHQGRHQTSLDGKLYLPDDRTTYAIGVGTTGAWDDFEIQRLAMAYDGVAKDYAIFVGCQSSFTFQVGIASAPHATPQNGPWTKSPNNPVLGPGASGAMDDKRIVLAIMFCDLAETDPNKRWKALYEGQKVSDGLSRIFYATAPDPPDISTWTKQGVVIDVGGAGTFDAQGVCSPTIFRYGGKWFVWYEAHDANQKFGLGLATGTDLGALTKDPASPYWTPTLTPDQALTATMNTAPGRTVPVTDTTGFAAGQMVSFVIGTNNDQGVTSRVRKVLSGTSIEIEHGVTGLTGGGTAPVRVKPDTASPNWTPRHMILESGAAGPTLEMVVWEPFANNNPPDDPTKYALLYEQMVRFTFSTMDPRASTPVMDLLASPTMSRDAWNGKESLENAGWRLDPFTGDGGGAFTQLLTVAQTTAASLLRGVGKALALGQSQQSALSKQAGKALAASQATSALLTSIKSKLLSLSVVQATAPAISKGMILNRAAQQATAATLAKGIAKGLTLTQATAATLGVLKSKLVSLAVVQATAPTLGKVTGKLLAVPQAVVPRLTKVVALPLAVTQAVVAVLTAVKQAAGATTVNLTVLQPTAAALGKAASRALAVQQAVSIAATKATIRGLRATQATTAQLQALKVRLLTLSVAQPVSAAVSRSTSKSLAAAQSVAVSATKATVRTISAVQGTAATVATQGSGQLLAALITFVSNSLRRVFKSDKRGG